eukprot:CAMPEP_0206404396 /NCGR_PEP_ID=MMETSP0294-20121207/28351_1 /ASSEMBLY_ACC=CAM_ASM_000327 /TAXON_ID=39354 /ORGANISM="Heterosigma akashiwo, Strain CCMP2393" /LENGTH=129 /DNA_ID=CAMNT_0053862301 /DNA_START=383 /DNA_END=768 /DNA_ORIENTATION=+
MTVGGGMGSLAAGLCQAFNAPVLTAVVSRKPPPAKSATSKVKEDSLQPPESILNSIPGSFMRSDLFVHGFNAFLQFIDFMLLLFQFSLFFFDQGLQLGLILDVRATFDFGFPFVPKPRTSLCSALGSSA